MTGTLLGGRVVHAQPAFGHRTGLEPVLLAASIPAKPGDHVLEGGTGSGAALLCLAARVAITGIGVERDPDMAQIARGNIAANGHDRLSIVEGDLERMTPAGPFDHAFANPPWHEPAGTPSPDPAQEAARRASPGLFARWARCLSAPLRHRGTLSFAVSAGVVPACLAAFTAAGCGSICLTPLWPRANVPATLVLLRAVKGGRAPFRLSPGLILHAPDGRFTAEAQAILRDGAAMP